MTNPQVAKAVRRRAINKGPNLTVAKARQDLYRFCLARIKDSMKQGFYLEAVALIESLICDRLESRLATIHSQLPEKRAFKTIGVLTQELMGSAAGESPEAKLIYEDVRKWGDLRNEAIHEFAKLHEADHLTWKQKTANAALSSRQGLPLFRRLDRLVRELNKDRGKDSAALPL